MCLETGEINHSVYLSYNNCDYIVENKILHQIPLSVCGKDKGKPQITFFFLNGHFINEKETDGN